MADSFHIEQLTDERDPEVRALLVDLTFEEQSRYRHPRQSREQVDRLLPVLPAGFRGENHIFVARDAGGAAVGVCWCALWDPGNGLEGEVAELVVAPAFRRQGIAVQLLGRARSLFEERRVTFAAVWTHPDNVAALAAYRRAGFAPTEQAVLTWLPTEP